MASEPGDDWAHPGRWNPAHCSLKHTPQGFDLGARGRCNSQWRLRWAAPAKHNRRYNIRKLLQTLIIGFAFIGLVLCLSIQFRAVPTEKMCPAYDALFNVLTPFGIMTLGMNKDTFSEENHSLEKFQNLTGWITLEEYKAWLAVIGSI